MSTVGISSTGTPTRLLLISSTITALPWPGWRRRWGGNGEGITGICPRCSILPIKVSGGNFGFLASSDLASAIRYAASLATVLNLSWGGGSPQASLESALEWARESARGGLGVPVFAAAGNSSSGISLRYLDLRSGRHRIRWSYSKDDSLSVGEDSAWLAWILLPGGELIHFENGWPEDSRSGGALPWTLVDDPIHSDEGIGLTHAARSGAIRNSEESWFEIVRNVRSGSMVYAYWVSSEAGFDGLRLKIDEGDNGTWTNSSLLSGVPYSVSGVSYPASSPTTIAVGASSDLDFRSFYSQTGAALDLVAPSSSGYLNYGVTTTDRTGLDGYSRQDYTPISFGGTSSATPLTAGAAGLILSCRPELTADQVRSVLKSSADPVGPEPYVNLRNDRYGAGRLNAYSALVSAGCPFPDITRHLSAVSECGPSGPRVILTWNSLAGDGSYDVYRNNILIRSGLTTPSMVDDLLPGDTYTVYQVKSNGDGGLPESGTTGVRTEACRPKATLSIDPNPIVICDGTGLGVANLHWDINPQNLDAEIRVEAPDGKLLFTVSGQGQRSTGKWVRDGMPFYLVRRSSGEVLATAIARVGCGSLTAQPNPIQVCDGTGTGVTTLSWTLPAAVTGELRLGTPTGTLFATVTGTGARATGKWVRNKDRFLMVNRENGATLATVTVGVTDAGCPDTTAPIVVITTPTEGQSLTTSAITVRGTASDLHSEIRQVTVRLNGGSWMSATGTGNWSRTLTLVQGPNTIEARAEDKAGNTATARVNVSFSPPVQPRLTASPNPIQVCDGSGLGVTTLSWTLPEGVTADIRIGSPSGNLFAAATGSGSRVTGKWVKNNDRFYLVNRNGGSTLASVLVTLTTSGCVDTIPPTVVITAPAPNARLLVPSLTVRGTAADEFSGLRDVKVRLNAGSWLVATGTANWSRSVTLVPGANRIEVMALDRAGNTSPIAAVNVTFDPSSLTANPSTIQVCDGTGQGITTLSWSLPAGVSAEIRVSSATGILFAVVNGSGSRATGKWVVNNTRFVLVNRADGLTLASTTVAVTSTGCPAAVTSARADGARP